MLLNYVCERLVLGTKNRFYYKTFPLYVLCVLFIKRQKYLPTYNLYLILLLIFIVSDRILMILLIFDGILMRPVRLSFFYVFSPLFRACINVFNIKNLKLSLFLLPLGLHYWYLPT